MPTRNLLLVVGGGGAFSPPPPGDEDMRLTTVKRTTDWGVENDNTTVEWEDAEVDDDGLWDIGDPTKIGPVPSAYDGKRAVFTASAIWASDATGYRELKMFRNGDDTVPLAVQQVQSSDTGNTSPIMVSRPIPLTTGDYFELCLRSDTSTTALAFDFYSVYFSIEVRMT